MTPEEINWTKNKIEQHKRVIRAYDFVLRKTKYGDLQSVIASLESGIAEERADIDFLTQKLEMAGVDYERD